MQLSDLQLSDRPSRLHISGSPDEHSDLAEDVHFMMQHMSGMQAVLKAACAHQRQATPFICTEACPYPGQMYSHPAAYGR